MKYFLLFLNDILGVICAPINFVCFPLNTVIMLAQLRTQSIITQRVAFQLIFILLSSQTSKGGFLFPMVSLGTPLENWEGMKPSRLVELNPNMLVQDVERMWLILPRPRVGLAAVQEISLYWSGMTKEWKCVENPWVMVSWWIDSLGKSFRQNPQGLWPLGFLTWNFPRDSIHYDTPLAFIPHIVTVLVQSLTSQ